MNLYRNKKTGVVIKTVCKVEGKNWELISGLQKPAVAGVKANPETATTTASETAATAAAKPKAAKKGKK